MRRVAWAVLVCLAVVGVAWAFEAGDTLCYDPETTHWAECAPEPEKEETCTDCFAVSDLAIKPGPPMPEFEIDYKALDGMDCTLLPSHGTTMSETCFSLGLGIETCTPEHTLYQLWCTPKEKPEPEPKASCDTEIAGVAKMLVRYDKQLLKGGKDITGWRETLMNVVRYCED